MLDAVNTWIDQLQLRWPPNRIVATLAPLVFVPLAGFVASWVADHFPGLPNMDPNWLAGIFITGAGAAIVAFYSWLDGWQKHEARVVAAAELTQPPAKPADPSVTPAVRRK